MFGGFGDDDGLTLGQRDDWNEDWEEEEEGGGVAGDGDQDWDNDDNDDGEEDAYEGHQSSGKVAGMPAAAAAAAAHASGSWGGGQAAKYAAPARSNSNANSSSSSADDTDYDYYRPNLQSKLKGTAADAVAKYTILLNLKETAVKALVGKKAKKGEDAFKHGRCPDMCPEWERGDPMGRYGQLETGDEPWEPGMPQFPDPRLDPRIDPTLWNPRLAVKSYVRADAGNAEANEHIRPTPVLTITVMYLCKHFVARYDALDGSNHSKKSHKPVGDWYLFLMWRFRQVRKDLSMQGLLAERATVPVIRMVERMLRFFFIAAHNCSDYQTASNDHYQAELNSDRITELVTDLLYMYKKLAHVPEAVKNEAEFRAYDMLWDMASFDRKCVAWPKTRRNALLASREIRFAFKVFDAIDEKNYVQFFTLATASTTTLVEACIIFKHFERVRKEALKCIAMTFLEKKEMTRPIDDFVLSADGVGMGFDTAEDVKAFVNRYEGAFSLSPDGANVVFKKGVPATYRGYYTMKSNKKWTWMDWGSKLHEPSRWIFAKCKGNDLGAAVYGSTIPEFELIEPHDSFSSGNAAVAPRIPLTPASPADQTFEAFEAPSSAKTQPAFPGSSLFGNTVQPFPSNAGVFGQPIAGDNPFGGSAFSAAVATADAAEKAKAEGAAAAAAAAAAEHDRKAAVEQEAKEKALAAMAQRKRDKVRAAEIREAQEKAQREQQARDAAQAKARADEMRKRREDEEAREMQRQQDAAAAVEEVRRAREAKRRKEADDERKREEELRRIAAQERRKRIHRNKLCNAAFSATVLGGKAGASAGGIVDYIYNLAVEQEIAKHARRESEDAFRKKRVFRLWRKAAAAHAGERAETLRRQAFPVSPLVCVVKQRAAGGETGGARRPPPSMTLVGFKGIRHSRRKRRHGGVSDSEHAQHTSAADGDGDGDGDGEAQHGQSHAIRRGKYSVDSLASVWAPLDTARIVLPAVVDRVAWPPTLYWKLCVCPATTADSAMYRWAVYKLGGGGGGGAGAGSASQAAAEDRSIWKTRTLSPSTSGATTVDGRGNQRRLVCTTSWVGARASEFGTRVMRSAAAGANAVLVLLAYEPAAISEKFAGKEATDKYWEEARRRLQGLVAVLAPASAVSLMIVHDWPEEASTSMIEARLGLDAAAAQISICCVGLTGLTDSSAVAAASAAAAAQAAVLASSSAGAGGESCDGGGMLAYSPGEVASARLSDAITWLGANAATPAETCGVTIGRLGDLLLKLVQTATAETADASVTSATPSKYVRQFNAALDAAKALTLSKNLPYGDYPLAPEFLTIPGSKAMLFRDEQSTAKVASTLNAAQLPPLPEEENQYANREWLDHASGIQHGGDTSMLADSYQRGLPVRWAAVVGSVIRQRARVLTSSPLPVAYVAADLEKALGDVVDAAAAAINMVGGGGGGGGAAGKSLDASTASHGRPIKRKSEDLGNSEGFGSELQSYADVFDVDTVREEAERYSPAAKKKAKFSFNFGASSPEIKTPGGPAAAAGGSILGAAARAARAAAAVAKAVAGAAADASLDARVLLADLHRRMTASKAEARIAEIRLQNALGTQPSS